ncbi:VOC family protein [Ensifer sp.]|jgi:catechol 2,3-dioxygenase-like lactoylglutathione lyase family enzyme|uniref:VOC family protein n=1 Tax=Ensifer sp. TaxID=1872086 RepID=UPI002E13B940|nr:VOC family protein [Ensifer sp.]
MTQALQENRPGLQVEQLHHVSLPVRDLEVSKRFYDDVLCLRETSPPRPAFPFPGVWYQVGAGQLHLIVRASDTQEADRPPPTFRLNKGIDSRDVHFAMRVTSFSAALTHLEGLGYGENATSGHKIRINRPSNHPGAGFPQIYILDPDGHVIEINALSEDS